MSRNKIYVGAADCGAFKHHLVEGLAVDAIVPGTLVKQTASGLATSDKAATVFDSEALVAIEQGAHVGADINTPYTIGDTAMAAQARSGEFFLVSVAAAQNITSKGAGLSSNGDGSLKIAATDGTEQILFYSDEIANTGGSAALVLVRKA